MIVRVHAEKPIAQKKHHDCIKIVEEKVTYDGLLYYMRLKLFGKTVFLTRESAEQALKEREQG